MDKVFNSKRDKNPAILRFVIFILFMPALVSLYKLWETNVIIGVAIFELIIAGSLLLHSKTTYKITMDGLLIVNIHTRKIKINIRDINSVGNENSWIKFMETTYINSPDSLKLNYKKYSEISISPERPEEFIAALQKHNPNMVVK